jgi:homoserine dehydrogenase
MRSKGLSVRSGTAQKRNASGYAEADPTFDIEGIDAAHKLALLSSIAFGVPINLDAAHIEGIADARSRSISSMPNNWDIASSCSASPSARSTGSNCAYTQRWCRCNGFLPVSKAR